MMTTEIIKKLRTNHNKKFQLHYQAWGAQLGKCMEAWASLKAMVTEIQENKEFDMIRCRRHKMRKNLLKNQEKILVLQNDAQAKIMYGLSEEICRIWEDHPLSEGLWEH